MSTSPGQTPNDVFSRPGSHHLSHDAPKGSYRSRPVDRAVAVAERRTLTGALERVADRHASVIVPEALYTDLNANVQVLMRALVLSVLSRGELATAADLCSALVRLMALQPARAWLDPQLILRVALLAHEQEGQNAAMMSQTRELLAAQARWQAAATRHRTYRDVGDEGDWQLVRELNALPLNFSPRIRALIARSIIRNDVIGARASLATFSRHSPESADVARRHMNRHAPQLASLFGAELAPTRPMKHVSTPGATRPEMPSVERVKRVVSSMLWPTSMVLATLFMVLMLVAPRGLSSDPRPAVETICRIVGAEHPSCLTAAALGTGLDHGDCQMAGEALPLLNDQLSDFGLNRELAVIRRDALGEFRRPFDTLEYSYATICL